MVTNSNLPTLDPIKVGIITTLIDWFLDRLQRTPDEKRDAELRKNFRKWEKGKRSREKYDEVKREIESRYGLEELVESGDYFVSSAGPGSPGVMLVEKGNSYNPKTYDSTGEVIALAPCHFKGVTAVFGASQSEYGNLPAFQAGDTYGTVVTCWRISDEAFEALRYERKIYLSQLTFGEKLQPVNLLATNPIQFEDGPSDPGEPARYEDPIGGASQPHSEEG